MSTFGEDKNLIVVTHRDPVSVAPSFSKLVMFTMVAGLFLLLDFLFFFLFLFIYFYFYFIYLFIHSFIHFFNNLFIYFFIFFFSFFKFPFNSLFLTGLRDVQNSSIMCKVR